MKRKIEYRVYGRRFNYQDTEVIVAIQKQDSVDLIEKSVQELFYESDWLEKFSAQDIRIITLCMIDVTIQCEQNQLRKCHP